ncbi:MAG: hypothetical protein EKK47_03785 [Burkholderiales bacterium]|jgi:hypothetical protein|nr:MAG: hypothetical protein EKK47_03785 [Burkholderiales bacterium]
MFRFVPSVMPASLRRLGLVVLACSAMALAGCGGGSRAKDYAPSRMVSFGDENSAFADIYLPDANGAAQPIKGLAYSVNSVVVTDGPFVCAHSGTTPPAACTTDNGATFVADTSPAEVNGFVLDIGNAAPAINYPSVVTVFEKGSEQNNSSNILQRTWKRGYLCSASNNWVKYVAMAFGFNFPNSCDSGSGAVSYAANGAHVAEIVAQVAAHQGELGDGVLVTIMGGQNDIIDLYNAVHGSPPTMTEDQAITELKSRAAQLARAVGVIFNSGAKVIVALTPDLGQSPLATTDGTSTLLSNLTAAFNNTFYIENVARNYNDGRKVAGVNTSYITDPNTRSSSYVYTTPACDSTKTVQYSNQMPSPVTSDKPANGVLYCTSDNLATNASVSTYIWADDRHFAPAGHVQIGSTAYNRAANQF